ncbi:MAG: hypothetical protein ABR526_05850 [Chthoniobacterales bacterium]
MDHVSPLRIRLLPAFAALCLSAAVAAGQDVALPQSSPAEPSEPVSPTPAAPGAPTPVPPPQIIPPDVLPMPDASALLPGTTPAGIPTIQQLDEELKPKQLSPAAEDYRRRIEFRKLRNQVQNNPAVKAALAASDRARTDLEKRALLGRYINVFFDRMIAVGPPDLKGYLNDRRREQLGALPQPRVRPGSVPAPSPKPKVVVAKTTPAVMASPALPVSSPTPSPSPARLP